MVEAAHWTNVPDTQATGFFHARGADADWTMDFRAKDDGRADTRYAYPDDSPARYEVASIMGGEATPTVPVPPTAIFQTHGREEVA